MNAPATRLRTDVNPTMALAPSSERRRLRIYMVQMIADAVCVIGSFVLAGGVYQGRWPAPMALLEAQVLLPVYLTIAPDSQDICFVPDGDYAKVVEKLRPEGAQPGTIVHAATGETLGEHRGIIHFTVGQRRGLEIGGQAEPLYVVGLDAAAAEVRVGPKAMLAVSAARLVETNRIGPLPDAPLTAKVRSLAKPVPVTLEGPLGEGAATTIRFAAPEFGVSPGQAAVIYAGERVVGGGWIEATEKAA